MSDVDRLRVLVVDDDPFSLKLLSRHLTTAGYSVITAPNGAQAMKTILEEGPRIVVTDWNMPEMDGLEFCRLLRSHEGVSFVYVIIVTAHTDRHRVVEAFEAGADDYLTKPVDRNELLARLRAADRIITLQSDLDRGQREVHGVNAKMAIAHGKLANANEKLHRLATVDELTGLTNRREALRHLGDCWAHADRHGEPLSCIMLDIDHFKNFNDVYGHAVGDLVLRETAEVLRKSTRVADKVCRVGGEEFLIVCPRAMESVATIGAERVRATIESHTVRSEEFELAVTISMGVAERTSAMASPDDLLAAADRALYAAKDAGRNRVCRAGALPASEPGDDASDAPTSSVKPRCRDSEAESNDAVLVVDEDAGTRTFCRKLLEREGFEVIEAVNGRDALGRAAQHPIVAVIMAAVMSEMDGLECTRRLKQDPETADVPVLIAAGRTDGVDMPAALQAGADDFVTKPFNPKELVHRVRATIRLMRELGQSNEVRAEQTRALGLLLDFSHTITSADSLDAVLESAVFATAQLTCSHRVSILLPDSEQRTLTIAKVIGMDDATAEGVRVPVGVGTAGAVFESGEAIVINSDEEVREQRTDYESPFFVSTPMVSKALCTSDHVVGVLNITNRQGGEPFTPLELEYVDLISNITASAVDERLTRQARDDARDSIVFALAKLAEYRDSDTGKHLDRVSRFSVLLAKELPNIKRYRDTITPQFLRDLERAVPLHDIGKVGVPDHILNKPGALTDEEFAVMRTHADIGARTILSVMERVPEVDFLTMAYDIALGHHEWYNGGGYPRGVSGEEIPLAARIAGVADVYDALTTKRVYKDAMPHAKAANIIFESSGTQFDPTIVDAFRRCEDEIVRLAGELADESPVQPAQDVAGGPTSPGHLVTGATSG